MGGRVGGEVPAIPSTPPPPPNRPADMPWQATHANACRRAPSRIHTSRPHLEVAVTTKYKSPRSSLRSLITASFPTPLGPLITITSGFGGGT